MHNGWNKIIIATEKVVVICTSNRLHIKNDRYISSLVFNSSCMCMYVNEQCCEKKLIEEDKQRYKLWVIKSSFPCFVYFQIRLCTILTDDEELRENICTISLKSSEFKIGYFLGTWQHQEKWMQEDEIIYRQKM